jgi:hypothetical protein
MFFAMGYNSFNMLAAFHEQSFPLPHFFGIGDLFVASVTQTASMSYHLQ